MPSSDHRPKVTLEDLLRLKRAERPAPEFWTSFERELRQKQLAALVRQQPWWHRLPRRLLQPATCVPVGVTAILALTFVSLRYSAPVATTRLEAPPSPVAASEGVARMEPAVAPATGTAVHVVTAIQEEPASVRFNDRVSVAQAAPTPDRALADVTGLVPWSVAESTVTADSPSARFIAANLERLEQTEPELLNGLLTGVRPVVRPRTQRPSNHAIDLGNVASNMARRTRIIPLDLPTRTYAREPVAPELVRERNARRLAEVDLSDQIRRLNVKGDRLTLKL